MTQTFTSFADLAAALCPTDKVKGQEKAVAVVEKTAFMKIEEKVGRKAAVIWALINDEETTKKSGPNGAILFDGEWIARRTGYSIDDVASAAFALIRHGLAKPCKGGMALKAA